jgi:hypothetical protein
VVPFTQILLPAGRATLADQDMLGRFSRFQREDNMKTGWLLPAAVALAIFALSIPSPIVSTKAFAQNTGQQMPMTKKNTDKPKGKLYKSPGDRAKFRMGNC